MTDTWTDENVALLKSLWADGWTGSRIAERIPGTTRSAIIGKVHRLQLPPRVISFRKRTKPHPTNTERRVRQRRPKTKVQLALESAGAFIEDFDGQFDGLVGLAGPFLTGGNKAKPPQPRPEDVARVSITDLEPHHCKWVCAEQHGIDQPVYCGAERLQGVPYCKDHTMRAYRPERPAKGLFRLTALDFDARANPRFVDNREPAEA